MPGLRAALVDTPVVLLNGARQTGKTTLAQAITQEWGAARYLTLDDATTLAAASADPAGFLTGFDGLTIIDEAQKVAELFPAIKIQVDHDRRPGRFLLTGSADVLMLPKLSESLAGRMEILTLRPFSQGEIASVEEGFIDAVFADRPPQLSERSGQPQEIWPRVLRGGFPEAVVREDAERRNSWFASYITAILQRDVRDLANIEGLTAMPRLLALLAARSGSLMNKAEISRATGFAYTTLDRYLALLEMTFLFQPLPAWSGNLSKRLTRSAKAHLCDSGLAAHLIGWNQERMQHAPDVVGPLLEGFVINELHKQAAWAARRVSLFHLRTAAGEEIDVVLEDRAGNLVAIEVKASTTLGKKDLKNLKKLAADLGERFHRGVVLYTGNAAVSFGPRLHALPVDALWRLERP